MLLPHPHRKAKEVEEPARLASPEECQRSEERDRALVSRARRRREEVAANRARFELTRDKIVFGFQLVSAAIALSAAVISLAA